MKLVKSLTTASALSLIMLGNAGAVDAPRNLQPLFGEFIATNPGLEVAVPKFKFVDNVAPIGYPESVVISYTVYALGTNTPLYTTPAKGFATPAIPAGCTALNQGDFDWNILFTRRSAQLDSGAALDPGSSRIHVGINMELECYDGTPEWAYSDVAGVYSANLSGVAGTGNPVASWAKVFVGPHLLGLNGIDTDGDLVSDKLTLTVASGPDNNVNATVWVVNGGTGVADSAIAYPLIR